MTHAGPGEVDPATQALVARLRRAGCVFAEEEAALLRGAARDEAALERLVAARVAGAPLEQVLGRVRFAGVEVLLDPGVFVPRQRTALLVEAAIAHLTGVPADTAPVVVDLGCGSGALAAAVLARVPTARVHAVDVDAAAVACARRNLPAPARVVRGDLWNGVDGALRGGVDVVLANGPYVPTAEVAHLPPEARDHEARVALDGGADGLDVARRVLGEARPWLAPGGTVLVECAEPQLPALLDAATAGGLAAAVLRDDERGALGVRAARA